MGNIKEYGAPKSEIVGVIEQPKMKASAIQNNGDALRLAGQAFEAVVDVALAIDTKMANDEKAEIDLEAAKMQGDTNGQMNEYLKTGDGTDKEFVQKTLEQYDTRMGELAGRVNTQRGRDYFTKVNTKLRNDVQSHASVIQAQLVGERAKQDFSQALDSRASAVYDLPTSYETARSTQADYVNHLVEIGSISVLDGRALQAESDKRLAYSSLKGMANARPETAKHELESGRWDSVIDEKTKDHLYGEIEREVRGREIESQRRDQLQKKALEEKRNVIKNEFIEKAVSNSLSPQEVLRSELSPEQKEHYIGMIKRTTVAPSSLKTNPPVVMSAFERISVLPDGDPRKITSEEQLNREFSRGGISVENLSFLRRELAKNKTAEGKQENTLKASALEMAKAAIVQGGTTRDPRGAEMYLGFQQEYFRAFDKGLKDGKTVPELTDPKFVKKIMQPFIRTPDKKLKDKATQVKKFTEKAGVTPAEKMNRMDAILKKKGLL